MALSVPKLQQLASKLPANIQTPLRSALAAQDKFNQDSATAIGDLGQWNWLTPMLLNGWQPFAGQSPRYTELQTGVVHLQGGIHGGSLSAVAFTLPNGFRPNQQCNFATESNGNF